MTTRLLIPLLLLGCSTTVVQKGSDDEADGAAEAHADVGASDVLMPQEAGQGGEGTNPAETGGHGSVDSGLGGGGGGPKLPSDAGGGSAGQPDASSEPPDAAGGAPGEPDGGYSDARVVPDGWLTLPDGYAYPPPPDGEVYPVRCPAYYYCTVAPNPHWAGCYGATDNKPGGAGIGAPCCRTLCECGADWGSGCEQIVTCLQHPEATHCI